MAVVPADLTQPTGRLSTALFPGLSVAARNTLFQNAIDEGADRSTSAAPDDVDAATRAWAYHVLYALVWERLCGSPASVGIVGEVQRQYTDSQIRAFKERSDDWLAAHQAFLPADDDVTEADSVGPSVPTSFRY
jgi:hypothetical protein